MTVRGKIAVEDCLEPALPRQAKHPIRTPALLVIMTIQRPLTEFDRISYCKAQYALHARSAIQMGQVDTSCLPTGTWQADDFRLRKTCRKCRQPLYGDGHSGHFPIAGVGVMHLGCAREYCQGQGITLEDAVPICKHWRFKGLCIYEVSLSGLACHYG